jgi:hypothetical protein
MCPEWTSCFLCLKTLSFYYFLLVYIAQFIIHSSAGRHLGWLWILTNVNNVVGNMRMCLFLQHINFITFKTMLNIWIPGVCGKSSLIFLRNHHTLLHNGYTNLHCHPPCTRAPFHHILGSTHCLSIISSLTWEIWYLIVTLVLWSGFG